MLNEHDAELIARNIVRLMRKDILQAAIAARDQVIEETCEDVLDAHQAAEFLNLNYYTLLNRKHLIPHTQNGRGGKIFFLKSELIKYARNPNARRFS